MFENGSCSLAITSSDTRLAIKEYLPLKFMTCIHSHFDAGRAFRARPRVAQLDALVPAAPQPLPAHLPARVGGVAPPGPLGVPHPAAEAAVLPGDGGEHLGAAGGATPLVTL